MEEYHINSLILKTKFKYHDRYKKKILKLLGESDDQAFAKKDNYYQDKLLKTDWPDADNWERPWVKYATKGIYEQLKLFAQHLGYQDLHLHKLWYQQYQQNDMHNWHTHHGNYTGTYYLEQDETSPYTEFLYPNNLKQPFTIAVEEGDMLFFPCYFIHRSALSKSKNIKSIISWNTDFNKIKPECFNINDTVHRLRRI